MNFHPNSHAETNAEILLCLTQGLFIPMTEWQEVNFIYYLNYTNLQKKLKEAENIC